MVKNRIKKNPNENTSLASCMIDLECFSEIARIVSPFYCTKAGSSLNKGCPNLFRMFKEMFQVDETLDGVTSPEIVEKMIGEYCFSI